MQFKILLLIYTFKLIDSLQIGYVRHASVAVNTSFIPSSSSTCSDCLCDCLTNRRNPNSTIPKCYGINCFPSNKECQRIEVPWIQEAEILFNTTSDQFISSIDVNFCSCYSSQNILDKYDNSTPLYIPHSAARYITYNKVDNTLIVLGDSLIGQYYVSNLTRFRSFSVSNTPLATCLNTVNIYISFYQNMSVNKYDMNMRFIQSIRRPISSGTTGMYGLAIWKTRLFVTDDTLELIWSIDINTNQISIFLNLTVDSVTPFNIATFENNLYITQLRSPIITIYNLTSMSKMSVTFPNKMPLYRLQMDPFCNRIWFGTSQTAYSTAPVLDLDTNEPNLYGTKGLLSQDKLYKLEFDAAYTLYAVSKDGNSFVKYSMKTDVCRKN